MADSGPSPAADSARRLLQRVLEGPIPTGPEFDVCRALLRSDPPPEPAFTATCMLLEGALADPTLDIDTTGRVVRLLKDLASGRLAAGELL